MSQSNWAPNAESTYAAIADLAAHSTTSVNQPEVRIVAAPGVDQAWLGREQASMQRSTTLFAGFRNPSQVDIVFATASDVDWVEQIFATRGYQLQYGPRWWMERDGCNIALSWVDHGVPVIFQCVGAGRDSAMYQQIAAHEYFHQVQNQYSRTYFMMPGWLTEGSASFFGIAAAVYGQGMKFDDIEKYTATYASSNYSFDVAAKLPPGTAQVLHVLKSGDTETTVELLRWSSNYGLTFVHTQFLLGGLLTEWLLSKYGLDSLRQFYEESDKAMAKLPGQAWPLGFKAAAEEAFKKVYGFGWEGMVTAAMPYLSARADQLLQSR